MFGNSMLGSMHDDLLQAEVSGVEAELRLVEALKDRAKTCIKSKNYPDASKLYAKGIEIAQLGNVTSSEHAVLHANKSMVEASMNRAEVALADAETAIALDSAYVKAYFRKSAACIQLKRYSEAKAALESGLVIKPGDSELLGQLAKINDLITAAAATATSSRSSTSSSSSSSSTTKTQAAKKPAAEETKSEATKATERVTTNTSNDGDDNDEDNLGNIRGYRKTKDGRTTTFFNHELDAETRSLIGDIAPKKVADGIATQAVSAASASQSAVWNSAGTYEERLYTPWTTARLTELLSGITITVASVEKVENVQGDSQISMMRGKRKWIYDHRADVHFVITGDSDSEDTRVVASIEDITADLDSEVAFKVVSGPSRGFSKSLQQQIEGAIKQALKQLDTEFKEK